MTLATLEAVKKIFGGGNLSDEEARSLFAEVACLTLSRATSADTNIRPVEVEQVKKKLEEMTGEPVDAADIRVAAKSSLYETAPLEKYLAKAAARLDVAQRLQIVRALSEVIHSDVRVSPMEVEFFNHVARALKITPAELVGLTSDD